MQEPDSGITGSEAKILGQPIMNQSSKPAKIVILFVLYWFAGGLASAAAGQEAPEAEVSFETVKDLRHETGLLEVYADEKKGRVLLALPAAGEDGFIGRYIYAEYLRTGLGSNPVGLDRSQLGKSYIIAITSMAGKILFTAENTSYVASAANPDEQAAVRQSFASSILWAGDIADQAEDGRILVDISTFLTRDVHGVAALLKQTGQGEFTAAPSLSLVDAGATLVFPGNIEMEAVLTFTSDEPGPEVRATAAEPRNVTLRLHHSFVALPEPGYEPRIADPRTGVFSLPVADYSAGLAAPVSIAYATRHRLKKQNPDLARSAVVEPIVYYIDPGVPEPVKSALIDGASWWAEAFDAAGFIDAYRVEELPKGAHPLDIRYNVINWVHRQTRGWSYGASVVDPRTGEILKGVVLLGSLRVRQDRMIFEGILGAGDSGKGGANDPVEIALARIRQLSAHEVGHTLGFAHNMAASTQDRASVMDYPAPEFQITPDGKLDAAGAYAVGVGEWDKFTVKWLYGAFPEDADVKAELEKIIDVGYGAGLRFVTDTDSRMSGAGHPYGSLWDTGDEPVASLRHTMRVRRLALNNFGLENLANGRPLSDLGKILVPVYLFHRYQVEAATKPLGGIDFTYRVKGDRLAESSLADPEWQKDALEAVLETLTPTALDLPDRLLDLLGPANREVAAPTSAKELFPSASGPLFDLLGAADAAAEITLGHLLHQSRLARLIELNRRDDSYPGLEYVLDRVRAALFDGAGDDTPRQRSIRRRIQARYVSILIDRSASTDTTTEVRAGIDRHLHDITDRLARPRVRAAVGVAHAAWLRSLLKRYLDRAAGTEGPEVLPPAVPPGSPIGSSPDCWHCLPD